MTYLAFLDDIFGAGKIADAVKTGEIIAAIMGFLAWALWHPATAMWAIGFLFVVAVLRKGWPFSNVPEITTFLGKAIVTTGLILVVGGFAWRGAESVLATVQPSKPGKSVEAPKPNSEPSKPSTTPKVVPPPNGA